MDIPDDILVMILDTAVACTPRSAMTYLIIRCVCRRWRNLHNLDSDKAWGVWQQMFYARWPGIATDGIMPWPKECVIGNKNMQGRVALHGSSVHTARGLAHATVASPSGVFYDVALRSIRRVCGEMCGDVLFVPATYADIMIVGTTLYVSTAEGSLLASNTPGLVSQVAQNGSSYISVQTSVTPLSNHDPDSSYGAALVYAAPREDGRYQCLLWIMQDLHDSDHPVAASRSIGVGVGDYKSVAISVDGLWVCVEKSIESASLIQVYRVKHGENAIRGEIKYHRDITVDHRTKGICSDLAIINDVVAVVGPDGRLTAWQLDSGRCVWEFGAGVENRDKASFVTAIAVHKNRLAVLVAGQQPIIATL